MSDAIVSPKDPKREPDRGVTQAYVSEIVTNIPEADLLTIINQVQRMPGNEFARLRTAVLSGVGWGAQIAHSNLFPGLEDAIDLLRESALRIDQLIEKGVPAEVLAELTEIRNEMAEVVHENVVHETQEEKFEQVRQFYMLPEHAHYTEGLDVAAISDTQLVQLVYPILRNHGLLATAYFAMRPSKEGQCDCPQCYLEGLEKLDQSTRVAKQTEMILSMPPGSPAGLAFLRELLTWWSNHAGKAYRKAMAEPDAPLPTLVGSQESKQIAEVLLARLTTGKPNAS